MITNIQNQRPTLAYRVLSAFIALTFTFSMIAPPTPVYAQLFPQGLVGLPIPGTMVTVTPGYAPPMITGITLYPDNPLMFDFIVDTGDETLNKQEIEDESNKLIKYFLASLTVSEEDMWVNLSPYEADRIIPEGFDQTEMGRDMLAQDYLLKQLTASLMYPEDELGQKFWKRVHKKAFDKFGTTEIPMNTFNKVWIVPESASIYEHENSVFVVASHLKVMLEEDYVAMEFYQNSTATSRAPARDKAGDEAEIISGVSSEVVREVLIPEIEKEVNQGETFANLRQIFNSMILATWYKQNLKESLLGQIYVNQNKTRGVDIEDKQENQRIYDQYVEAFKKGVYNYIREDYDPATQEIIPRKYFSGGIRATNLAMDPALITKETSSSPVVRQFLAQQDKINDFSVTSLALEVSPEETPETVLAAASPIKASSPITLKELGDGVRSVVENAIEIAEKNTGRFSEIMLDASIEIKGLRRKAELAEKNKEIGEIIDGIDLSLYAAAHSSSRNIDRIGSNLLDKVKILEERISEASKPIAQVKNEITGIIKNVIGKMAEAEVAISDKKLGSVKNILQKASEEIQRYLESNVFYGELSETKEILENIQQMLNEASQKEYVPEDYLTFQTELIDQAVLLSESIFRVAQGAVSSPVSLKKIGDTVENDLVETLKITERIINDGSWDIAKSSLTKAANRIGIILNKSESSIESKDFVSLLKGIQEKLFKAARGEKIDLKAFEKNILTDRKLLEAEAIIADPKSANLTEIDVAYFNLLIALNNLPEITDSKKKLKRTKEKIDRALSRLEEIANSDLFEPASSPIGTVMSEKYIEEVVKDTFEEFSTNNISGTKDILDAKIKELDLNPESMEKALTAIEEELDIDIPGEALYFTNPETTVRQVADEVVEIVFKSSSPVRYQTRLKTVLEHYDYLLGRDFNDSGVTNDGKRRRITYPTNWEFEFNTIRETSIETIVVLSDYRGEEVVEMSFPGRDALYRDEGQIKEVFRRRIQELHFASSPVDHSVDIQPYLRMLRSEDAETRKNGAIELGEITSHHSQVSQVVAALNVMLISEDEDQEGRNEAAYSLKRIGTAAAKRHLAIATTSVNDGVRHAARIALEPASSPVQSAVFMSTDEETFLDTVALYAFDALRASSDPFSETFESLGLGSEEMDEIKEATESDFGIEIPESSPFDNSEATMQEAFDFAMSMHSSSPVDLKEAAQKVALDHANALRPRQNGEWNAGLTRDILLKTDTYKKQLNSVKEDLNKENNLLFNGINGAVMSVDEVKDLVIPNTSRIIEVMMYSSDRPMQYMTYFVFYPNGTASSPVKPVLPRTNPAKTWYWGKLEGLAADKSRYDLRTLFNADKERTKKLTMALNDEFKVDFSKNLIDYPTFNVLIDLAKYTLLGNAIEQMFTGEKINETEGRAVLHTALRNVIRNDIGEIVAANGPVYVDGKDVMPKIIDILNKVKIFSEKVRSGEWKGATGKRIKHVVNIGIGGSDLGPRMASKALTPFGRDSGIQVHFVSNVDGTAPEELMRELGNPEETLFVIESKTFTTQETVRNAVTLKNWVTKYYENIDGVSQAEAIRKHFVAVSTATDLVKAFGIDTENMFEFWDWVGGRYSLWSAIGLTLATYIGFDNFLEMLEGAREMDEHFRTQPFGRNIPVLKALIGIWYRNFYNAESYAVVAYDEYSSLLSSYLAQGYMESNGKGTDRSGNFIKDYQTAAVLWGGAGTDMQHATMQQWHQGTSIIPGDIISVKRSQNPIEEGDHHRKLYANAVAQPYALAFGFKLDEVKKALDDGNMTQEELDWLAAHRTFPGNKPTTSILLEEMDPRTLGSLIAMYEHQIMAEGIIYNIFSFDQWGVELGKVIAKKDVLPFLDGSRPISELDDVAYGESMRQTIEEFNKINKASSPVSPAEQVILDFMTKHGLKRRGTLTLFRQLAKAKKPLPYDKQLKTALDNEPNGTRVKTSMVEDMLQKAQASSSPIKKTIEGEATNETDQIFEVISEALDISVFDLKESFDMKRYSDLGVEEGQIFKLAEALENNYGIKDLRNKTAEINSVPNTMRLILESKIDALLKENMERKTSEPFMRLHNLRARFILAHSTMSSYRRYFKELEEIRADLSELQEEKAEPASSPLIDESEIYKIMAKTLGLPEKALRANPEKHFTDYTLSENQLWLFLSVLEQTYGFEFTPLQRRQLFTSPAKANEVIKELADAGGVNLEYANALRAALAINNIFYMRNNAFRDFSFEDAHLLLKEAARTKNRPFLSVSAFRVLQDAKEDPTVVDHKLLGAAKDMLIEEQKLISKNQKQGDEMRLTAIDGAIKDIETILQTASSPINQEQMEILKREVAKKLNVEPETLEWQVLSWLTTRSIMSSSYRWRDDAERFVVSNQKRIKEEGLSGKWAEMLEIERKDIAKSMQGSPFVYVTFEQRDNSKGPRAIVAVDAGHLPKWLSPKRQASSPITPDSLAMEIGELLSKNQDLEGTPLYKELSALQAKILYARGERDSFEPFKEQLDRIKEQLAATRKQASNERSLILWQTIGDNVDSLDHETLVNFYYLIKQKADDAVIEGAKDADILKLIENKIRIALLKSSSPVEIDNISSVIDTARTIIRDPDSVPAAVIDQTILDLQAHTDQLIKLLLKPELNLGPSSKDGLDQILQTTKMFLEQLEFIKPHQSSSPVEYEQRDIVKMLGQLNRNDAIRFVISGSQSKQGVVVANFEKSNDPLTPYPKIEDLVNLPEFSIALKMAIDLGLKLLFNEITSIGNHTYYDAIALAPVPKKFGKKESLEKTRKRIRSYLEKNLSEQARKKTIDRYLDLFNQIKNDESNIPRVSRDGIVRFQELFRIISADPLYKDSNKVKIVVKALTEMRNDEHLRPIENDLEIMESAISNPPPAASSSFSPIQNSVASSPGEKMTPDELESLIRKFIVEWNIKTNFDIQDMNLSATSPYTFEELGIESLDAEGLIDIIEINLGITRTKGRPEEFTKVSELYEHFAIEETSSPVTKNALLEQMSALLSDNENLRATVPYIQLQNLRARLKYMSSERRAYDGYYEELKRIKEGLSELQERAEEFQHIRDVQKKQERKPVRLIMRIPEDEDEFSSPVGGINLNPELIDLQIKRDGNGIPLPVNLQPIQDMKIDGFVPIIINVAPILNMPLLLGFADSDLPIHSAETNPQTRPFDLSLVDKYCDKYYHRYETHKADVDA